ncbi:MAG: glycosyltransferase family 4 protein [Prevotellaceae bacterium]|jgi:glycosyltransferase involved in cell wall biosynthesis|nr:glycosyltransferase family 4 protein [Prevotellaceae bacterium]
MKITILTSPFGCIPPHAIGAIEKRWYNVAKEFVVEGHDVEFIAKKPDGIKSKTRNDNGLKIKFLHGYQWKKSRIINLSLDFIYSLKALLCLRKTDIVVFNTVFSPILSLFFRWKMKVSIYNVARFPKGQFKYFKHIDRLSCVSAAVYNELIRQTPQRKNQAKIISNPVDTAVFQYIDEKQADSIIIMYAGRIHPEKGLDILVQAYEQIVSENTKQKIILRLVGATSIEKGGGGTKYIDYLKSLTRQEIEFVPPIYSPNDLWNEIVQCNIFCYPSIAEQGETFGVAPLEAMAAGRATVVSALECFQDFAKDGENALVFNHRENTIENLKTALCQLVENQDLRKQLGIKANQTAQQFSNQNIAKTYLEDFYKLLKNK